MNDDGAVAAAAVAATLMYDWDILACRLLHQTGAIIINLNIKLNFLLYALARAATQRARW